MKQKYKKQEEENKLKEKQTFKPFTMIVTCFDNEGMLVMAYGYIKTVIWRIAINFN